MIELVSHMLKNALRKIPFAVPAVRFARFRSETLAKALRFRSVTDTFDDYYKMGYWGYIRVSQMA